MIGDLSMADVLQGETKPTTVKTVTVKTVDFEETEVVTPRTVDAMVQPADPKQLQNLNGIEFSQAYVMVHALQLVENGELVEYKGADYKVITRSPWEHYGYTEAVAEATNEALR